MYTHNNLRAILTPSREIDNIFNKDLDSNLCLLKKLQNNNYNFYKDVEPSNIINPFSGETISELFNNNFSFVKYPLNHIRSNLDVLCSVKNCINITSNNCGICTLCHPSYETDKFPCYFKIKN